MQKLIPTAVLVWIVMLLSACGGSGTNYDDTQARPRSGGVSSTANDWIDADDARYEDLVQRLYVGYFGRPADPAGLVFYAHAYHQAAAPLDTAGLYAAVAVDPTIRSLVDSFAASLESAELYHLGENAVFGYIHGVYDNLFSRLPDAGGAAFWRNVVQADPAGMGRVMLAIMTGARGADADLFDRKIALAKEFTAALRTSSSDIYTNMVAAQVTRAMMRSTPGIAAERPAILAAVQETITRLSDLAHGHFQEIAPSTHQILLMASAEQMASNGIRIRQLATVLETDLNQLRSTGLRWKTTVITAPADIQQIRQQLRGYQSALLIGKMPMPMFNGAIRLDPYRLPDCAVLRIDASGELAPYTNAVADLNCKNGLIISVLRGTSEAEENAQIANKLDQMIAYHRASAAANNSWLPRMHFVNAVWGGIANLYQRDLPLALQRVGMYPGNSLNEVLQGSGVQKRDSFLDCITGSNEYCGANLHGDPLSLRFEGPGKLEEFYSSDFVDWHPAELGGRAVQAKYIALSSCSTHAFQYDNSVGTSLLMRGNSLLTRGTTELSMISDTGVQNQINNEFPSLNMGGTVAEALLGMMEGTTEALQGDPYITMRPASLGKQPKLVMDGVHYNNGTIAITMRLPDSVNGSKLTKVITYTNRGDAELRLRLGVVPLHIGRDTGSGFVPQGSDGSDLRVESMQIYSDGRILTDGQLEWETYGGTMHATLQPGQSVAITYRLAMPTDAQGQSLAKGLYSWEIVNTSNDPANARTIITMMARVR